MSVIDQRYAHALADLVEAGRANPELLGRELGDLAQMLHESPELRQILGSPAIPVRNKRGLLQTIVTRAGLSPLTRNLLLVLNDRGRLTALPAIANDFQEILLQRRGVHRAEVVSARVLDQEEQRGLEQRLAAVVGGSVQATYRQDPSVIGGFLARVGDTVFDGSLRGRLERMRQRLVAGA